MRTTRVVWMIAAVIAVGALVALAMATTGRGGDAAPREPGGDTPRQTGDGESPGPPASVPVQTHSRHVPTSGTWVYQLQRYEGGTLDAVAAAGADVVVIDLARDAGPDWFTREEVSHVQDSGAVVLAYFEIGAIENFRPEASAVAAEEGLMLNRWEDWPEEHFITYWDERWWDLVVRPRIDQALAAGFDGIYLDTPLAYEEIDLSLVPGTSRSTLARRMADLIVRISEHAKAQGPGFLVVPQNSPELRLQPGYLDAVDGIGMEELFVLATDELCTQDWCEENLDHTRALRDAGKFILAVDYADDPGLVAMARRRYAQEGFLGYVGPVELNTVREVQR